MHLPVTCDGGLEDIDGSLPRAGYRQDEDHADQRGIFQGDSLSPLLFCMALNSLSTELNRTGYGYRMSTGNGRSAKRQLISHLLYMDDLKLYGRNPDQLDGLLHTVRAFSDDIRMKFGLDKCAIAHFVNGKLSGHNTEVKVGKTETIKGLKPVQVYKYLGVDESNSIQHSTMRERLGRENFRRVKMVLRTELYGRNKVLAINGLALPVLTYSFGVIHWRTTDLQQLDRRTRKLLTMHGVHHPSADVDRLDCMLLAMNEVEACSRSRQCTSLAL